MFVPRNHEKIQTISEIVREELSTHTDEGGVYHDERAGLIAAKAIHAFMPELIEMQKERIVIDARLGVLLGDDQPAFTQGVHVEARLQRISIQELISVVADTKPPITMSSFDLCAVMIPQYVDPEPQEIIFGQELYVPFKDIEKFEAAA